MNRASPASPGAALVAAPAALLLAAVLLAAVLLAAPAARAITTDRPDAAESAWTVGHLRLQLETGVEAAFDEVAGTDRTVLTLPTKIRFGILDFFELHLQSEALVHQRVTPPGGGTASSSYGADLDFGFKFHGLDGGGLVPAVAVLASVTAPVGSRQVTSDAWLLTPIVAVAWDLPLGFGLGGNVGFTVPLSDREAVGDVALYSVSLGRSLAPVLDMLGVFVQFYGESPLDEGDTLLHVGGGVTVTPIPDLQLDVYVNGGVTEAAPDLIVGGGLSFRL